jgi:soluble lytic murein transglycosylase-like protein
MSSVEPSVRARSHRSAVALVVLGVVLVALLGTDRAGAQTQDCEQVWSGLVAWTAEEANEGLSPEGLDTLRSLQADVDVCTGSAETGAAIGVERWRPLVEVYFGREDVDRVLCLMERESGGDPGAVNPSSGASGLMQVMPDWADVFGYRRDDLFDPLVNLWISSQIGEQQGWGAWTPYLRGSCR